MTVQTLSESEVEETTAEDAPQESVPLAEAEAPADIADDHAFDDTESKMVTLSEADRILLARRPYIEAARKILNTAKEELAEAELEAESAKAAVKGKTTALEVAWLAFEMAHDEDEAPAPMPLFDPANASGGTQASPMATVTAETQAKWQKHWDAFLNQSVIILDVPDGIKDKLAGHSPEAIQSLADLVALKAKEPVRGYTAIKGIGEGKADQLDTAYEKLLMAFLAEHPNPEPGASAPAPQTAPEAQEDAPRDDYDFVGTFPQPVNPTPNESFDDDYHKKAIADAVEGLEALAEFKTKLKVPGLKPKEKKTLESRLAETQMNYDEGFTQYGGTFGTPAADRLRKFVEAEVERKANLKGGL